MNELPANQRDYWIGGLMRCCTKTLSESDLMSDTGTILNCLYCSSAMMVGADGKWQWVTD